MELEKAINTRKSVRSYTEQSIEIEKIEKVLTAGCLAPSGKNGQPWKFIVVQNDKKLLQEISKLTVYDSFVRTADCLIVVFLDKMQSYNYIKDVQSIGACIQNMLLTITDLGLSACWIGEILNRDVFVKKLLDMDNSLDLMAVITVGYENGEAKQPPKKQLDDCLIKWV